MQRLRHETAFSLRVYERPPVGARVRVYWDGEARYYEAEVRRHRAGDAAFEVVYFKDSTREVISSVHDRVRRRGVR